MDELGIEIDTYFCFYLLNSFIFVCFQLIYGSLLRVIHVCLPNKNQTSLKKIFHDFLELFKVTVHHFRKIGGCLDGRWLSSLVLVFISPRCLEPVGLTKNLAPNTIMSFDFFKNVLTLSITNYINSYLTRLETFSVNISTSK